MYMRDYQHEAKEYAVYPNDEVGVLYPFLGLVEEAGEVVGKIAKAIRKGEPALYIDNKDVLVKELGDVLWMLAACCTEIDVPLDVVAQTNLAKLEDRQKRNTIVGEGDNR